MEERIDILGAGLSGLAAATILAKAGKEVHVHEIRKDSGARFDGDFQGIENWTSDIDFFDETIVFIESNFSNIEKTSEILLNHWAVSE